MRTHQKLLPEGVTREQAVEQGCPSQVNVDQWEANENC
jgi:hypothetical protein